VNIVDELKKKVITSDENEERISYLVLPSHKIGFDLRHEYFRTLGNFFRI
jgi:hypothetical protein